MLILGKGNTVDRFNLCKSLRPIRTRAGENDPNGLALLFLGE